MFPSRPLIYQRDLDETKFFASFEKLPRREQVPYYITTVSQKGFEHERDTNTRLRNVLEKGKPVVIVEIPKIAESLENFIFTGEGCKCLANAMSLSSFVLNPLKMHGEALTMATGGLGLHLAHSYFWGRGPLSKYVKQTVKPWPMNEKAVLPKTTILVRKPKTGSFLVRAALAVTAVSVSAYLFWKSKT